MARIRFFPLSATPSLAEVASWCGATLAADADPSRVILDVAALDQAGPGHLTFLDNPRYLDALKRTQAAAALVSPRYAGAAPATCAVLIAAEPYRAMALVMTKLYPSAVKPGSVFGETGISQTASVHPSARLEPGVVVDPGAVVGRGAACRDDIDGLSVAGIGAKARRARFRFGLGRRPCR